MDQQEDFAAMAKAIIDSTLYMVLGTADESGQPWVSPVYFTASKYKEFYWISSPETKHSRNIAKRSQISIVIFNWQVPVGKAQAVYMSAIAEELTGSDLERGLFIYNGRLVDFITSLDGYGAAEGWPGFWGLEGPEYLAWLGQRPEGDYMILMGANTYRLMYGFASQSGTAESDLRSEEEASVDGLTRASKVVFSSTLQPPLSWANTRLISGDAVEAVREMKREGNKPMSTLGSLTLCRSLLKAGLVDRFRVVVFPVITGSTGYDRMYDGYPDVALAMVASRTFDGRLQLLEYVPRVLAGPPGTPPGV